MVWSPLEVAFELLKLLDVDAVGQLAAMEVVLALVELLIGGGVQAERRVLEELALLFLVGLAVLVGFGVWVPRKHSLSVAPHILLDRAGTLQLAVQILAPAVAYSFDVAFLAQLFEDCLRLELILLFLGEVVLLLEVHMG